MAPEFSSAGLGVSQTWGIPARRPGATDSLFAKQVLCHPAGVMGELDDVMHMGQCSLVTADGLWPRQAWIGTCSATSSLCVFAQVTSVSEIRFLPLENENCKPYLAGLLGEENKSSKRSARYVADTEQMVAITIESGRRRYLTCSYNDREFYKLNIVLETVGNSDAI